MTPVQQLRQRIQTKQASIGSWLQIPSPDVAEIMAQAGYEWICVDMEHGAFAPATLPDIFRAITCGGALPFVRVPNLEAASIKSALDAGAQGIIFPMIKNAAQLEQAIAFSRYPSSEKNEGQAEGLRGVGYSRANAFGQHFASYLHNDSEAIIRIAQIEHAQALSDLEKILACPFLDGIFIGPYDLSASLGCTGNFSHPDFIAAIQHIEACCLKSSLSLGAHIVHPNVELLKEHITRGYCFLAYGTDAVFLWNNATCPTLDSVQKDTANKDIIP